MQQSATQPIAVIVNWPAMSPQSSDRATGTGTVTPERFAKVRAIVEAALERPARGGRALCRWHRARRPLSHPRTPGAGRMGDVCVGRATSPARVVVWLT